MHIAKLAMDAGPHRIFEVIHSVNDLIIILPKPQHDAGLGVHPAGFCLFQDIQRLEVASPRIPHAFLQHRRCLDALLLTHILALT